MNVEQTIDDAIDERPIAVRRKRRVQALHLQEQKGTATADLQHDATTAESQPNDTTTESQPNDTTTTTTTPATTPQKTKRVRFSDPGAELMPSTSTGLTPALRRHRVASFPKPKGISKRRHSFPTKLASPTTASAATLQFAPLRQVIDGRSKRRLRRNHLSEEINAIEEEKSHEKKMRRDDITALKREVEEKDEMLEQLNRQLDHVKQACVRTPPPDGADRDRDRDEENDAELGLELDQMVDRAQQQEHVNEGSFTAPSLHSLSGFGMDDDDLEDLADKENVQPETSIDRVPSPAENRAVLRERLPDIPTSVQARLDDHERDLLEKQIEELKEALQTVINESERTQSDHQRLYEKIQGHLQDRSWTFSENPSEMDAALDLILTSLVLAQTRAEDAKTKVATLSSSVKDLGFDGATAEEMIGTIKQQFRQARLELEYLQPGETVEGFENAKLLGILLERVRLFSQKMRDSEEERDHQRQATAALQEQLHLADVQAKVTTAKGVEIAKELYEKERSSKNLQRALEGYRKEVKDLEDLVNRLEAEHAKAMEQSRKDKDEAVADLEVKLGVETRTKEEAIREAQEKKALAESLQETIGRAVSVIENLKEERDILLTAKDAIVSRFQTEAAERERAYETALAASKGDADNLRSEKTAVMVSLKEAEVSIGTLTDANTALEARLSIEIANSVRVMESMQSEMMRSLARVGELKNGYVSSKNGDAGMVMPATPCSLRFASTPKKKRRFDSGIGVVEEEDEEMLDI
ncbi:MAG: hypothetical protein M1816_000570 [Peltula sp. TS41687]|nr:MAG: hypothetical protein M1816_000570 [Peltula sp. TS41687]